MKPLAEIFGENVAEARKAAGYSQAQLGEELEVNHMTVSRWERGETWPGPEQLEDLADALGTTPGALLTPSKPPKEKAKPREDPRLREALTVICRALGYRLVSVGRKT